MSSVAPDGLAHGKLLAGDEITSVDDVVVAGKSHEDVVQLIIAGTKITLVLLRAHASANSSAYPLMPALMHACTNA